MYPNNESGRKAYDRHQTSCLPTLLPGLDPDPPVLLCARTRPYDLTILAQLRQHGWPGTGQHNPGQKSKRPKAIKAITLARRIAKGSNLTGAEISLIADRISWLMRNPFRWKARDGYAALTASKATQSKNEIPSAESLSAPTEPNAKETIRHQDVPESEASGDREAGAPQTPTRHPEELASKIENTIAAASLPRADAEDSEVDRGISDMFGENPTETRSDDLLAGLGSDDGRSWEDFAAAASGAGNAVDKRVSDDQLIPLQTAHIEDLPYLKTRSFLLAIDHTESEQELRRKAEALLADKPELFAALSASQSLKQDITDACAALGIDLPC